MEHNLYVDFTLWKFISNKLTQTVRAPHQLQKSLQEPQQKRLSSYIVFPDTLKCLVYVISCCMDILKVSKFVQLSLDHFVPSATSDEERGLVTIERFLGCAESAKCHWYCDLSNVTEAKVGSGYETRSSTGYETSVLSTLKTFSV